MEKLKEVLGKVPVFNFVAAALCLTAGTANAIIGEHMVFATIELVVGSANAWVVYRRAFK